MESDIVGEKVYPVSPVFPVYCTAEGNVGRLGRLSRLSGLGRLLSRSFLFDGVRDVDFVAAGALGGVLSAVDGVNKPVHRVAVVGAGGDGAPEGARADDTSQHAEARVRPRR